MLVVVSKGRTQGKGTMLFVENGTGPLQHLSLSSTKVLQKPASHHSFHGPGKFFGYEVQEPAQPTDLLVCKVLPTERHCQAKEMNMCKFVVDQLLEHLSSFKYLRGCVRY